LALLIDRQHDGMVRRIDVQANDLLELGGKSFPSGRRFPTSRPRSTRLFPTVDLSDGYRSRSSAAAARAPHSELDRNHAPLADCRTGQNAPAMSMLFSADDKASAAE
jgi:hypothetical protein